MSQITLKVNFILPHYTARRLRRDGNNGYAGRQWALIGDVGDTVKLSIECRFDFVCLWELRSGGKRTGWVIVRFERMMQ